MKKTLRLFLLSITASIMLFGCNKNTPKKVAQVWLTGYNRMDFEKSMELSTPDTRNLLNTLKELTDGVSDSGRTELMKINVTIKEVKEDGDRAVVTYISSDNPRVQSLNLVKQNTKWLVLFTKTDLLGTIPVAAKNEAAPEEPAEDDSTSANIDTAASAGSSSKDKQ